MKLESLLQYADEYLGVHSHPDYRNALNGLQVAGASKGVRRIAAAVDASEASVAAAADSGADLLLVHHGLFWDGLKPITGRLLRRIRPLLESDIALYSVHLPLDSHAEVGNCALLARALGVVPERRFGLFEGVPIGWWGRLDPALSLQGLADRLATALVAGDAVPGSRPSGRIHVIAGGPEPVERVGVVTGGGASFIGEAAELGLDALVTGEGPHHAHFDAVELGLNVLFGGHYATETFGVKALAAHLADRFSLEWVFLDLPTGL